MIDHSWVTFPAGLTIATISSLTGIGGGILWVPFFILFLELPAHEAVILSLGIQIFGQGSGALANNKLKRIDWKLVKTFSLFSLPGVVLGSFLSQMVPGKDLALILGIICIIVALAFLLYPEQYSEEGRNRADSKELFKYWWASSFASVLAGFLSVGIGDWLVPLLNSRLRLKMSCAVANALALMFFVGLWGSCTHLVLGNMPAWNIIFWGIPGVLLGGQLGPRLTCYINEYRIKEVFIFLLTLTGCHIIFNAL